MALEPEVVTLRDGSRVVVRRLQRSDRDGLVAGLQAMSPRSRYLRFGSPDERSDDEVDRLLDTDGEDHLALVALAVVDPDERATVRPEDGPLLPARPHGEVHAAPLAALDLDGDGEPDLVEGPGIGVVRFLRDPTQPTVAETTMAVVDAWQGRGVGTVLLERLVREAQRVGVKVFRNYVMEGNTHALALLRSMGAEPPVRDGGVLVVDVPVPRADERLRESLAGRTFMAAAVDQLRFVVRHPIGAIAHAITRDPSEDPAGDRDPDPVHAPHELSNPDLDAWLAGRDT